MFFWESHLEPKIIFTLTGSNGRDLDAWKCLRILKSVGLSCLQSLGYAANVDESIDTTAARMKLLCTLWFEVSLWLQCNLWC